MGSSLINLLEGFEQLAYRLLIWIILIPKTIVKIIFDPGFAPGYIHDELENDKDSPFDEYMSPVILYLGITLIPALASYFMPSLDTISITGPLESSTMSRAIDFQAESDFRGDTSNEYHDFQWIVRQCVYVDEANPCNYEFVSGELHSEANGLAKLISESEAEPAFTWNLEGVQIMDRNTVSDTFHYEFQPGSYQIEISGRNSFETNFGYVEVYVPDNADERVEIFNDYRKEKGGEQNWEKLFSSGTTIFLGLALLLPPLLFALAGNLFHVTKKKLSETDLKQGFYMQCYYFVPIGLAAWAWYYSKIFYASDISIPSAVFPLPFWLVAIWFVIVETKAIARDRQMKKTWYAIPILLLCIFSLLVLGFIVLVFIFDINAIRVSALWFYPLVTLLLVLSAIVIQIKKWFTNRQASREQPEGSKDLV